MNLLIDRHRDSLIGHCRKFRVGRLEVFGSAADGGFNEARSDLDFLVDFVGVPDRERFDAYFGLLNALEDLFQRKVALVEIGAPRNPYFIRRLKDSGSSSMPHDAVQSFRITPKSCNSACMNL